jgi:hypothetical protein
LDGEAIDTRGYITIFNYQTAISLTWQPNPPPSPQLPFSLKRKRRKKVDPAPSAAVAARKICDNDSGVDFFEEIRRACHFRWSVQFQVGVRGSRNQTKKGSEINNNEA